MISLAYIADLNWIHIAGDLVFAAHAPAEGVIGGVHSSMRGPSIVTGDLRLSRRTELPQIEGGFDNLSRHQVLCGYFPIAFRIIHGKWNALDVWRGFYQRIARI